MAITIKKVAGDGHVAAFEEELEVLNDLLGWLWEWREEVRSLMKGAQESLRTVNTTQCHQIMEIGREYRNTLDRIAATHSAMSDIVGGLEAHKLANEAKEEPVLQPVMPRQRGKA